MTRFDEGLNGAVVVFPPASANPFAIIPPPSAMTAATGGGDFSFGRPILGLQRAMLIWLLLGALVGGDVRAAVDVSRAYFESGGKRIAVDVFAPRDGQAKGAVLVLPGAGGMLFDGPQMKRVARGLAETGHVACVVNYFNRTDSRVAWNDAVMVQNFATWMATVSDAVDWVSAEHANGGRVGVFGYSLGGFLAVAVGSKNDRVGVVVEQAGGIWDRFYDPVDPLPPVLVIHGRKDERVDFEINLSRIQRLAERHGTRVEVLPFDSEGHRFSNGAMRKVVDAAAGFLAETLDRPGR
ncbi:MAG: dienelactone hydrolase family protein [Terrimicrobiaceae bacterium]|nr:dienelactone hydrolase family protein [Terrimicrobiaceae bacterium]